MAGYSLQIDISPNDFPEIGAPFFPKETKAVKPSKSDRQDYNSYYSESSMNASAVQRDIRNVPGYGNFSNLDGIKIKLDYEKETSKTYKFLGMDVDENFDAIIKMGQGHVVVSHMFDRDEVLKILKNKHSDIRPEIVNDMPEDVVRKLATGLKTGIVYDLVKKSSDRYENTLNPDDLDEVVSVVSKYLDYTLSADNLEYKSILLNLVHVKKTERDSVGSAESRKDLAASIISTIFKYWVDVVKRYNTLYSLLSCMDIWGDMNRRIVGQGEFNSRMSRCVYVMDNATGTVDDSTVSFNGISLNRSISDSNVIRKGAADSLSSVYHSLTSPGSYTLDSKDLLLGFIETDGIDDVYSLSESEIQALSVLDSLAYIDEDASLCKESYDMNDPDQRGLFVKSSIRSYERNFKEFKPASNYDVTDALADMVERGDVIDHPVLVSQSVATDDTEETVVTSSSEEIDVKVDKAKLLKVLKLVYKSTEQILKGF